MKYLRVLLDEFLTWSPQISHVQMKLNRAIGIVKKLRHQANIHILKTVYHSHFGNHLLYACQLWGQRNKETQNQFRTLQNRARKKIESKKRYESADPLYKNLKILKFQDFLQLNNCLFMCQLEQNKKLAATFPGIVYTKEKHNYNTRSARKNLLDISLCKRSLMGRNHANTNASKIGTDSRRKTQLRT